MSLFSPRWLPKSALLVDLAIGAALAVYLISTTTLDPRSEQGWEIFRDVCESVAVGLRRVWTVPALVVVLVATVFSDLATWPYPLGMAIMLFTAGEERLPRWLGWAGAAVGMLTLILPWPSGLKLTWGLAGYVFPQLVLFTVAPLVSGFYARERQALLEAASQRAADAERRQKLEAERIRAEERTRLANEIHDVVAHRVSLMVVHTGALKLSAKDERTREVAELVRSSGRLALEELRELVGVLRSDETAPLGPTPNLENVRSLVEESRAAGTEVRFFSTGTRRKLASTVERTAYRVVQESLTNARKHAPLAPVRIGVVWKESTLDIQVSNGPTATPVAGFPASGYGLPSLRERAALVNGTVSAGPAPDGGWIVHAILPYGGDK
jgi:signal transduction histidine kinase